MEWIILIECSNVHFLRQERPEGSSSSSTTSTSRLPAGKASPASTGTSRSPAPEPRKHLPPSTLAAPSTSPNFKSDFNTSSSKSSKDKDHHHSSSSSSKKKSSSSLTAPPPIMQQRRPNSPMLNVPQRHSPLGQSPGQVSPSNNSSSHQQHRKSNKVNGNGPDTNHKRPAAPPHAPAPGNSNPSLMPSLTNFEALFLNENESVSVPAPGPKVVSQPQHTPLIPKIVRGTVEAPPPKPSGRTPPVAPPPPGPVHVPAPVLSEPVAELSESSSSEDSSSSSSGSEESDDDSDLMDVDEMPVGQLRHLPSLPILPSHKKVVPAPAPSMPSFDSIGGLGHQTTSSKGSSMPTHLISADLQLSESSGSDSDSD